MIAKVLPQGDKIERKHRNFRLGQPVMCPAVQTHRDQYAVQHTAHGGRVVHGFPELANNNNRENDRGKIDRYERIASSQVTVEQNGH
ncbi:hypothetical protein D3C73_1427320 [compost metagenome]